MVHRKYSLLKRQMKGYRIKYVRDSYNKNYMLTAGFLRPTYSKNFLDEIDVYKLSYTFYLYIHNYIYLKNK